jgi:hypothetical protein
VEDDEGRPTASQWIEKVDAYLDRGLDRILKADEPVWTHQAQIGRLLILLSGGAIVASVSMLQSLAGRVASAPNGWLLPTAWVSWALALLVGVTREGWMSRARAAVSSIERKRGSIRTDIRKLGEHPDLRAVETILLQAIEEAETRPRKATKVTDALAIGMYLLFLVGMTSVVAFAIGAM